LGNDHLGVFACHRRTPRRKIRSKIRIMGLTPATSL
jgi:hypothetical protein